MSGPTERDIARFLEHSQKCETFLDDMADGMYWSAEELIGSYEKLFLDTDFEPLVIRALGVTGQQIQARNIRIWDEDHNLSESLTAHGTAYLALSCIATKAEFTLSAMHCPFVENGRLVPGKRVVFDNPYTADPEPLQTWLQENTREFQEQCPIWNVKHNEVGRLLTLMNSERVLVSLSAELTDSKASAGTETPNLRAEKKENSGVKHPTTEEGREFVALLAAEHAKPESERRSNRQVARDFRPGDAAKQNSLYRMANEYKHLWKESGM